jgi:hypothetical protein
VTRPKPARGRPLPPTLVLAVLLGAVLSACAPAVDAAPFDTPAAQAVERVAHEAYHRMEIGRLRTGSYTTNVLVDLELPQGARVTVEAFSGDSYVLRVTSDAVEGAAWLVGPSGVRRTAP